MSINIDKIRYIQQTNLPQIPENIRYYTDYENDKFDKSNDGKFEVSEAAKNFGKGVISPVKAIIEHPVISIGIIGATILATTAVPVIGPILAFGFGTLSICQLGKGMLDAVKNYKNGQFDDAEKSFQTIGESFTGTALSGLAMGQSARVAKEAKFINKLGIHYITDNLKCRFSNMTYDEGFVNSVKEVISLVTTKNGLKAIKNEFRLPMIKLRLTQRSEIPFEKTQEGIRRAALSDKNIKEEITTVYNEVFDKLKVPTSQRPKLIIRSDCNTKHGGSYCQATHKLEINPDAYKAGTFEIEDVLMHEATHCKQALLRAGIPQARADEIVRNELISRIINGEAEEIICKGDIIGADMMTPPAMSQKMRLEFAEFAKSELYNAKDTNLLDYVNANESEFDINRYPALYEKVKCNVQPMLNKLTKIIDNNPEFIIKYGTKEEALMDLAKYALSHNFRYNYFKNLKVGNLNASELQGKDLALAEKSLVDNITTIEGNGRISGFNSLFATDKDFNQYQFSPEEVLAQQKGNKFLISKNNQKLRKMRAKKSLTLEEEARILKTIDNAKTTIQYKTKGFGYYKKYIQLQKTPNNTKLAKEVQTMEQELELMHKAKQPNKATFTKDYAPASAYQLMNELQNSTSK